MLGRTRAIVLSTVISLFMVGLSMNVVAEDKVEVEVPASVAPSSSLPVATVPPWVEVQREQMEQAYAAMMKRSEVRQAQLEARHETMMNQAKDRRSYLESHHEAMLQQALDQQSAQQAHFSKLKEVARERREEITQRREQFSKMSVEEKRAHMQAQMQKFRARKVGSAPPPMRHRMAPRPPAVQMPHPMQQAAPAGNRS